MKAPARLRSSRQHFWWHYRRSQTLLVRIPHTRLQITANPSFLKGELVPLLYWAAVEDGLAITAAAIATLRPLLAKVFPGSSINNNYNMITYPSAPKQKVFDNSQGGTSTDIGHTSIHERGSQTAILEPVSPKRDESISLTTEVSVTYNRPS